MKKTMWSWNRNSNRRPVPGIPHPALLALVALLPAASAPAASVNLFTPDMQKIKEEYVAGQDGRIAARTNAVADFLSKHIEKYNQDLTQHKRTGNVTKMGIARTAMRALQKMKTELNPSKPVAMPERVRRELKADFKAIGEELKTVQTPHAGTAAAAKKKAYDAFLAACESQGADIPPADQLEKLFNQLLATKAPEPKDPDTEDGTHVVTVDTVPETAQVLSMSGPSVEWATIGFVEVTVNALDLLEIKIGAVRKAVEKRGKHMMNDEPYKVRYTPSRVFEPVVEQSQFQIKSVPGKLPIEILEWPDARNEWTLSFRVRPAAELPSVHVVELMAGYEGANKSPLLGTPTSDGKGDSDKPTQPVETHKVTLTVESDPEGAGVFLNGRRVRVNKRGALTPCTVEINAGTYDLVIRKYGFNDVYVKNLAVDKDTTVSREMDINKSIVNETVTVSPKQSWRNSRVKVDKGEDFAIAAKGRWACGSDREVIGPGGYPNDRKYFKYYANAKQHPRQVTSANYGALLMRIGANGEISSVGTSLKGKAPASGYIYFDINESPLPSHRADNIGALTVNVRKFGAPSRR